MGVTIANKPNPYTAHLASTPIIAKTTVTKEKKLGGGAKEEKLVMDKDEVVSKGQVVPVDQLYRIEVGGGMTVNLGNYESARIDVRLTVPCTKDDLESAYDWASDFVSGKIQAAVADAKG